VFEHKWQILIKFSHVCKKAAEMTAKLICYFGFSLFNCLEITVLRVWKIWKTRGISFCQICEHPVKHRPAFDIHFFYFYM